MVNHKNLKYFFLFRVEYVVSADEEFLEAMLEENKEKRKMDDVDEANKKVKV